MNVPCNMPLPAWMDRALAVLFDAACLACGTLLGAGRHGPVCATCWTAVRPLPRPCCARCGDALRTWRADEDSWCATCRAHPPAFDAARAAGVHDAPLRDIVHALKYGRHLALAPPLSALMRDAAGDWLSEPGIVAVPVPLHPWRSFRRGFNQADALARGLGVPVWAALRRSRAGRPQAGLRAAERRLNARSGHYALRRRPRQPLPGVVVLVDDVLTTGATAEACAQVLKAGGVGQVRVLTAARAVSGSGVVSAGAAQRPPRPPPAHRPGSAHR